MKKHKISIVQLLRHLVQLIFFIFLPALYISTFNGIKQIYVAVINHSFSFNQLAPQLIEAVAIIPVTIIMGRFFCGWMCSLGTFGDLIYGISRKVFKGKYKIDEELDEVLKYVKYVVLVLLIVVIWSLDITTFKSFNPWDVFGMITAIGKVPDFSYLASSLLGGLVLFILIVIGSAFIERFFCRYLCPLGAVFAITSKLRIAKIKKPSQKCGACRICTTNCAMGLSLYKANEVCSGECIQCMRCITACPRKNATLTVSEKDVKPMIVGAAAVSVMTGFYYAGNLGINAAGLNNTNVTDSSKVSSNKSALYKDGTYEGTGTGFRGASTTVSVEVKNGKITDITTVSYGDDRPFYSRAFETVTEEIVSSQSVEVDSVSGATFSSRGIMAAVEDALSNAKLSINSTDSSSVNTASSDEETSAGEGTVSAQNTEVTAQSNVTPAQSTTDQSFQSASSNSQIYKDGIYKGTGIGFRGAKTTVSVTVRNGKITDIATVSYGDDRPFYNRAFGAVSEEIVSSQSTEVDSVSGATFSSRGIMAAVEDALNNAK